MEDSELFVPHEAPTELEKRVSQELLLESETHESYAQLVWRRFRRSKAAIAGALLVLALTIMAA